MNHMAKRKNQISYNVGGRVVTLDKDPLNEKLIAKSSSFSFYKSLYMRFFVMLFVL